MDAVIYARVSSAEQVEGYSIDAQIDLCRQWANQENYNVVRVYVERGKSAKTDKRPAFQKMIANAIRGETQAVIVHKSDRFARNLLDMLQYKKELSDNGVKLYSVTEPIFNGDSAENEFVVKIMGAAAEYIAQNIGNEAKKGQQAKAKAGHWPGSHIPIGYVRIGEKRNSTIEISKTHGAMIAQSFEDFVTGYYTLESWSQEAKKRGYRSLKGNIIRQSGWHLIFRNAFYMGQFVWKGEKYQGKHRPLVTEEVWNKVQSLLEERNSGGKEDKHFWLLQGLLWSTQYRKSMNGNLAKGKYAYYRAKSGKENPEHCIKAGFIEQQVIEYLSQLKATSRAVPAPDEWVLALLTAANIGVVYEHLPTQKAKKQLLNLVFPKHSIWVNPAGLISVQKLGVGFEII